jgi:hypothetical protein
VEVGDALGEVLHDEGCVRDSPQDKMEDETASAARSSRKVIWYRHGELPTVLRWRNNDGGAFVSFPKARWLLGTCS